MPADDMSQHAIVLSGNGANAAYEVGVMKALLREACDHNNKRPIYPEIYSGTSVGALNAAVMASRADQSAGAAVEFLEKLWVERIASSVRTSNGIFRVRGGIDNFVNPAYYMPNPLKPFLDLAADSVYLVYEVFRRAAHVIGSGEILATRGWNFFDVSTWIDPSPLLNFFDFSTLIDLSSLERLVREAIDTGKISLSKRALRITAMDWEKSLSQTFANADLEGEDGYRKIIAAIAIPGILPSQTVDDHRLVDGAVLVNEPLKPAITARDQQASERLTLHVIYLDPEFAEAYPPKVPDTFYTTYRLYVLAFARSVNADIERVREINDRLFLRAVMRNPEPSDAASEFEQDSRALLPLLEGFNRGLADKIPLTVHRYRCRRNLGPTLGLLNFQKYHIEELIGAGYEEARKHDCKESQCLLPTGNPSDYQP
jgi:predicted acylesterase/phospholipase RssA